MASFLKASPSQINCSKLLKDSKCIKEGNPGIFSFKLRHELKGPKVGKYYLGVAKPEYPEKVIMIVGAAGSGKTTLINGLVNYIFGVKWDSPHRFKLIDDENQTNAKINEITSYTMYHQEGFTVPYTLTIVDTPGFGDAEGLKKDTEVAEDIRKFESGGSTHGIDAIGFVTPASLPRLSPMQMYVFQCLLTSFGKDKIFLLTTFADSQKPRIWRGMKEDGLQYRKALKFNNAVLFMDKLTEFTLQGDRDNNQSDSDGETQVMAVFNRLFWEMGEVSSYSFLKRLSKVAPNKSTHPEKPDKRGKQSRPK